VRVYLDNNASMPIMPEALSAVNRAYEGGLGNPSSPHRDGRHARASLAQARQAVMTHTNMRDGSLMFTSGATESNNMALRLCHWEHIIMSEAEHDSLWVGAHALHRAGRSKLHIVPVGRDGRMRLSHVQDMAEHIGLCADSSPSILLVLTWGHNESGVMYEQDMLEDYMAWAEQHAIAMHIDGAQMLGRMALDIDGMAHGAHGAGKGCFSLSLSSHKMGGPHGVGVFYLFGGGWSGIEATPYPLLFGGGQEGGLRGGSENVPAIVGFAAAVKRATQNVEEQVARWHTWRRQWEDGVKALGATFHRPVKIIHDDVLRLPNTTACALSSYRAETLVIGLDQHGVSVSRGSACSVAQGKPSRFLRAIGQGEAIDSVIRISFGWQTRASDVAHALVALEDVLGTIEQASPHKVSPHKVLRGA